MLEMLRVIREQEPSKPSTKLSTAEGLPTLAANRGTEPAKLTKLVRGELDWIVMKALEKDRNRRYETANGFAMDVQRYLADEPVQACPPSVGYRLRKFARRNKGRSGRGGAGLVFPRAAGQRRRLGVARSGGAGRRAGEPPGSGHRARGDAPTGRQAWRSPGGTGTSSFAGPRNRTRIFRGRAHRLVAAAARCTRTGRRLRRALRSDPARRTNRSGCREECVGRNKSVSQVARGPGAIWHRDRHHAASRRGVPHSMQTGGHADDRRRCSQRLLAFHPPERSRHPSMVKRCTPRGRQRSLAEPSAPGVDGAEDTGGARQGRRRASAAA